MSEYPAFSAIVSARGAYYFVLTALNFRFRVNPGELCHTMYDIFYWSRHTRGDQPDWISMVFEVHFRDLLVKMVLHLFDVD
jgi:hypothetical protein